MSSFSATRRYTVRQNFERAPQFAGVALETPPIPRMVRVENLQPPIHRGEARQWEKYACKILPEKPCREGAKCPFWYRGILLLHFPRDQIGTYSCQYAAVTSSQYTGPGRIEVVSFPTGIPELSTSQIFRMAIWLSEKSSILFCRPFLRETSLPHSRRDG
jgi:hypothetical protein